MLDLPKRAAILYYILCTSFTFYGKDRQINMLSVNFGISPGNHRFIIHNPPSAYLCPKPNPVLHLSLRFQMRRYEKGIMAQAVANQ